ncbi:glycine oxidase ThiO [Pleionea sediminis]|uniref:glycine oxidase ThiO n=1 Tax=Pleionea sediminis TaxID=2569479 RepID=UPI001185421A|nr:glycine oxidase ThiO [Pleionea sediminis]
MKAKVGIAGAGIMGRLLAMQLIESGYSVSIFDQDSIESGSAAAYTAAGMLTPYTELESAEQPIYNMGLKSLKLWPKLISTLQSDLGFQQQGTLVVAHNNDKADFLKFNQQLNHKKISSDNNVKRLSRTELSEKEPELNSSFDQAIYLEDEAWLNTQKTMQALAKHLLGSGINWYAKTHVSQVHSRKITTLEKSYPFDWVIDTRGLGAKPQWQELRGVRGELVWLKAPEVKLTHMIRLMHPRYRLYVVPQLEDQLYIIGATQIESHDFSPISVRSMMELLSASYAVHSGFGEAKIIQSQTNCRPALRNNLPQVLIDNRLIKINGLFRHGFLLAPTIAQEVTQWLNSNESYQSPFQTLFSEVA